MNIRFLYQKNGKEFNNNFIKSDYAKIMPGQTKI
jgi:hypothetical protein